MLRKITQAEFDAFERDEYGYKICPTGDYSEIKSFGEECSFGELCSFGGGSGFGGGCSHEGLTNSSYFACDRIGSERRKAYFFRADEGYYVRAGCFFGTMDAFEKRVKEVHGGTRYEREYLAAVELAKIVLGDGCADEKKS